MFPRVTYETRDGVDRRGRHRYPISSPVALTVFVDDQEYTGQVEDVSLSGIRVRLDAYVAPSADIEVSHPATGRFRSECRWRVGNRSGFAFKDTDAAISLCVHCLKQMVPMRRPA